MAGRSVNSIVWMVAHRLSRASIAESFSGVFSAGGRSKSAAYSAAPSMPPLAPVNSRMWSRNAARPPPPGTPFEPLEHGRGPHGRPDAAAADAEQHELRQRAGAAARPRLPVRREPLAAVPRP